MTVAQKNWQATGRFLEDHANYYRLLPRRSDKFAVGDVEQMPLVAISIQLRQFMSPFHFNYIAVYFMWVLSLCWTVSEIISSPPPFWFLS
jgi:hypothetical protein